MENYKMDLYWSAIDKRFIAAVPDLPGCISDGKTRIEAVKNAEEMISIWIGTAQKIGRTVPSPTQP